MPINLQYKEKELVMPARIIRIWTDGAALGNPSGEMGWGWADNDGRQDCGGASMGTNQIGELTAIFMALRAHPKGHVRIYTDSQYCINVFTKWAKSWKRNDWKKRDGTTVLNLPLIKAVDRLIHEHDGDVDFEWVKGHSGDKGNETADKLAHGYAVSIRNGEAQDRMPVEGVLTLEQSYADGGPNARAKALRERKTRTLHHVEGETPHGHWRMRGNNNPARGPVSAKPRKNGSKRNPRRK